MLQIDTGICAAIITLLLAIVSLAAWIGALSQKVKINRTDIDQTHKENREDHAKIFTKLDEINNYLRNGYKSRG